ncbi:MAG: NfeD family protein [Actinomycetes bacterium]
MRRLASRSRRTAAAALVVLAGALGLSGLLGAPAGAATDCTRNGCVDVVAVGGLIDRVEADFIEEQIGLANQTPGATAVLLQLDSAGAAVDDATVDRLAGLIAGSRVPVSVWIGPSGATARGAAAQLVQVATDTGISPGSDIGNAGEQVVAPGVAGRLFTGPAAAARTQVLGARAAVAAGVVDRFSPTIGDHILGLDGVRTTTVDKGEERRTVPVTVIRFSKLPLLTQLFHTVASPSVAYLLMTVALGLLLFEFFTAGVGVAGVIGAVCLVLGSYGVAELPHRTWALVLMVLAMVGFGVDVQTGVPRLWTIISMVGFTVGSVFLFTDYRSSWLALAAGLLGMGVSMFSGMPAMVRTRFATPTVGREWMVGEEGEAVTAVDPEGTVRIKGALWRALTNRATPIQAGDPLRVAAIDGLVLEVEPLEGAAMDYREMRDRRKGTAGTADGGADPAEEPLDGPP